MLGLPTHLGRGPLEEAEQQVSEAPEVEDWEREVFEGVRGTLLMSSWCEVSSEDTHCRFHSGRVSTFIGS